MAFRTTYSRVDNSPEAQATSSLEMVISIGKQRLGRCQGLRYNYRGNPRPLNEIGSDRTVEFLPGLKNFSGSLQLVLIQYGPALKRLAALTGTEIDPNSLAATLTNFPEFEIELYDRGNPNYRSPELYAPVGSTQDLAGGGRLVQVLMGCVIESGDFNLNASETMVMESVSFQFVDIAIEPGQDVNKLNTLKVV